MHLETTSRAMSERPALADAAVPEMPALSDLPALKDDLALADPLAVPAAPVISVIIPVRNAPRELRSCLAHLQQSEFQRYEVIVVDDASTDGTADVAREMGVRLLRLETQSGPGLARNCGAAAATAEYLLFLDADVCVYPTTLGCVLATFASSSDIDAVFGSYDTRPRALNIISQYRNLLHHFVHQQSRTEASTFWAGCGAIKRDVFHAIGGFAPQFRRPCIEDIEMGLRLRKAGYRIVLNKLIQVTHLKRWTFWNMLKADVLDRGIPWTQLILREGAMPNDLNLRTSQRVSLLLTYGLLMIFAISTWQVLGLIFLPMLGLLTMLALDEYSMRKRVPTLVRGLVIGAVSALCIVLLIQLPAQFAWALVIMLGIMLINAPLYAFFARQRNPLFAVIVFPLQLMFYGYCGIAFGVGVASHYWRLYSSRRQETHDQSPGPTASLAAPLNPLECTVAVKSDAELRLRSSEPADALVAPMWTAASADSPAGPGRVDELSGPEHVGLCSGGLSAIVQR